MSERMTADEYWSQGTRRLDEYHRAVTNIVDGFPEPRRARVRAMLDGPMGEQFMTAPASTRRAHHNAYPCGLVAHSLTVVTNVLKIAQALAPGRWALPTLTFCGLFHDFGKAGSPGLEYYREVNEEWKRKRGEFYEVNPNCPHMDVSQRTLFTLQQQGITLDHDEYLALMLADGQYVDRNKDYRLKEPHLAVIVHMGDLWTTLQEKQAEID